jgi:hypothetical protein
MGPFLVKTWSKNYQKTEIFRSLRSRAPLTTVICSSAVAAIPLRSMLMYRVLAFAAGCTSPSKKKRFPDGLSGQNVEKFRALRVIQLQILNNTRERARRGLLLLRRT